MLGYLSADNICSENWGHCVCYPSVLKIGEYPRIFPSFSWGIFAHVTRLDQSRANENIWWFIIIDIQKEPTTSEKPQVTHIVLPFRSRRSDNTVRRQTSELSLTISVQLSPVFSSRKLNYDLKPMEQTPALVNKQKVVYHFQIDQCEGSYDGYTSRNLHQTVDEHMGKTHI